MSTQAGSRSVLTAQLFNLFLRLVQHPYTLCIPVGQLVQLKHTHNIYTALCFLHHPISVLQHHTHFQHPTLQNKIFMVVFLFAVVRSPYQYKNMTFVRTFIASKNTGFGTQQN